MALLEARDLRKLYGPVTALGGVDLSVEKGEFVTLLGPSGSGKTTLLMAIAGFAKLDAGSIALAGEDITAVEPEDRNFGFVFQGYALFPHMSVEQNIGFPLSVRKWSKDRIKIRVAEMLSLVGLEQLALRKPRELSGGQQQRVAIARALSFDPKILLLDEPLSALDRTLRETMQRELRRLHRQTGVTFIYVTHDQEEAIALSDRIAVFNFGQIVQVGTPHDLYYRPANRFVAGFLGVNNVIEGQVTSVDAGKASISMLQSQIILPISGRKFSPGDKVFVWVRPEDLTMASSAGTNATFEGTVADQAFLGSFERIVAHMPGGVEFIAQLAPGEAGRLTAGQTVRLFAPIDKIGLAPVG